MAAVLAVLFFGIFAAAPFAVLALTEAVRAHTGEPAVIGYGEAH